MTKRLFIAIPLPSTEIVRLTDYFKLLNWDRVSWTKPENLHLTIYFLGDVKIKNLPIRSAAADAKTSSSETKMAMGIAASSITVAIAIEGIWINII